ncbi:hypothetical protein B0H99_12723 [Planomicrobium soli]|uniref:Uncharacterized protein n=1 Tax=Planomicrobium soli TaxID=1176648 RepID=A0A2P8FQP3_9BACL|nr:hypothetical protein B0H99_12723 [Planomicrobium soli]
MEWLYLQFLMHFGFYKIVSDTEIRIEVLIVNQ